MVWPKDLKKEKKETPHTLKGRCRLFDPRDVETASNEGVSVSHLLNDFAGGLSSTVAWLCVHKDEKGICLLGAATYNVLQSGDVLEGMQRHYPVIVVACQQKHSGVLDPIAFWYTDVMKRGVSAREDQWDLC